MADSESEPHEREQERASDPEMKRFEVLAFALNLMSLNYRTSQANGRGRSGAVPAALPTERGGPVFKKRW